MSWLVENWYLLIVLLAIGAAVAAFTRYFVTLPTEEKEKNLKEWLKYAVVEAEKKLGTKTGQLKLRLVYDWAVSKFPWIIDVVSFNTFELWVDEALDWMKAAISTNKKLQEYIESEEE